MLLRGYLCHDCVVDARRLIVPFLVHPKAGTRRVLRELTAIGYLDAGAGGGEAVSDTAVAAAARRAAKVRAMWARLGSRGFGEGAVEEEITAAEAAIEESRRAAKRARE